MEISSLSSPVSLSIEDWISSSGDLYSTVSIHFISVSINFIITNIVYGIIKGIVSGL